MALGNPCKPSGCSNHVLKQKLKREHHLKGALRNQSNKHQNSLKPMLKAEQKTKTSCMPKTAVSPNFKAHQLGLARPKYVIFAKIFVILALLSLTDEPKN